MHALSQTPEINFIAASDNEESPLSIPSTDTIRESQMADPDLCAMLVYIQGVLPEDDRAAQRTVLESKQLDVVDGREDPLHPVSLSLLSSDRVFLGKLTKADLLVT